MEIKQLVLQKLKEKFPQVSFVENEYHGDFSITLPKQSIVEVCNFIKTDPDLQFVYCEDITAVDWAKRTDRFTVVYHIFSIKHNFRLRLRADVDEKECSIDTVTTVWKAANWQERETYDMYGIKFNNHPDLRRMYMPEEFEYHPLRKDFPLMGIPGSLSLPKK